MASHVPTSPYPAPLRAWLSLGPGNRKPFLAQALDPEPCVTSHLEPVPPESSRWADPQDHRHLGVGNTLPKAHPIMQDKRSETRQWPASGHQEEGRTWSPSLKEAWLTQHWRAEPDTRACHPHRPAASVTNHCCTWFFFFYK